MLVRDIMTSNVITIPSDTLMVEAGKTMEFHKIERLPVVDRGKLVGIVTKSILERSGPSEATSLSRWELTCLLSKIMVKEIMHRKVVTVTPSTTVESAVATAQGNKIGSLPVLDDGRVVGIVTTNDLFYKILNPLMGVGEEGTRIVVREAGAADQMQKVMECLSKAGVGIKAVCTMRPPDARTNEFVVHLDMEDAGQIIAQLKGIGFTVETREFKPC